MQETKLDHPIVYHHVKSHVRKHKKRYLRFIIFFIFLIVFEIVENLTAVTLTGIEFNTAFLIIMIVVAIFFTAVAEITEIIFEKEKPKIEKMIKKEEKAIKKEEKIIEKDEKENKRKLKKKF